MDLVTKQKSTLWLIIILVVLNITTIVMLWLPGGIRPRPERHPNLPKHQTFFKELDLTQEQKKKFDQYRNEYFRVIEKYTRQINLKKYEIMDMLFQPEPDSLRLNNISNELGQLNTEFEKVRFRQILRMKTILTDEQFNLFKIIVDESYKPKPGDMGPPEFDGHHPKDMPPPPPGGDFPPDDLPPPPHGD
jgi:Spy/CpxP family protein refolding chaperone